jgi:hypothetical protein
MNETQKTVSKVFKSTKKNSGLRKQYEIIRGDLKKLKVDLQKGYHMARKMVEKDDLLNQLLKK